MNYPHLSSKQLLWKIVLSFPILCWCGKVLIGLFVEEAVRMMALSPFTSSH